MKEVINKIFSFFFKKPLIAENGDIYRKDNDGDGKRETEFVEGYTKEDGIYVRSHYRKD